MCKGKRWAGALALMLCGALLFAGCSSPRGKKEKFQPGAAKVPASTAAAAQTAAAAGTTAAAETAAAETKAQLKVTAAEKVTTETLTETLRLRDPDDPDQVLTVVPMGTQVQALGSTADGQWVLVKVDGQKGLVAAGYFVSGNYGSAAGPASASTASSQTQSGTDTSNGAGMQTQDSQTGTSAEAQSETGTTQTLTEQAGTVMTTVSAVSLRDPSDTTNVLTTIPAGEQVSVNVVLDNGWIGVSWNGVSGVISSGQLR